MSIKLKISILSDKEHEYGENPKRIKKEKLIEETIEIDTDRIEISPDFLTKMFPGLKEENLYGFNASINCEKATIKVCNFEYFSISAFTNTSPSFSIFKVVDINNFFRLNGLIIDRFDVEKSNLLLVESQVKKLNVGFGTISKDLMGISKIEDKNLFLEKTDIRGSDIERARICVPNELINLQRSEINYITLENKADKTNKLKVWENSNIERFKILGNIDHFKISNSNILDLEFTENSLIKDFKIESSIIKRTHNCVFESFEEKNMDTLQLIINSAINSSDHQLYTNASFEYMKLKSKQNENVLSKLIYNIMRATCGYGYKPLRPIMTSIIVWMIFGGTYWALPMFGQGGIKFSQSEAIVQDFALSFYFSIVTFTTTGFGDVVPVGIIAKTLSGIESILGIVIASLFIFTLTKRFGNLY